MISDNYWSQIFGNTDRDKDTDKELAMHVLYFSLSFSN